MQNDSTTTPTIAADVAGLLTIAERAIEYHDAEQAVRAARGDFFEACTICKAEMGVFEYIARGTDAWERLKDMTAVERDALRDAKQDRHNAARRLQTAVRRYRAKVL